MEEETEQQQTANFYRLIRLLIDIGGEALRDVLLKEIPSNQLETVIRYNKTLLEDLKKKKVLTDPQWNLLQESPPDPSKFDISLLVALLRNICPTIEQPTPDWNVKVPGQNDFSTGAELLRIKNIRNTKMHVSSTLMPNATFEPLWIELSGIIQRIASKVGSECGLKTARKIVLLEGAAIDPSGEREKEVFKALEDWKTQIVDILNEKLNSVQESLDSLNLKSDQVWDVVDAVRSHGDTINETLASLQGQVTRIADDISSISHGVSSITYQAQGGGDNFADNSSDIRWIKEYLQVLHRELASIKQQLLAQRTQTGQQPSFDVEDISNMAGDDIPDVGDLSNRDIDKIAQSMGFEWERIATFLDYEHGQIDALKSIYRDQPVERNNRMLQKWRDVVVGRGESPRILLAAAFASIEHNEMAQSLVPAEQVEEIKDLEAKKETKKKIKGIKFDCQGTDKSHRKSPVIAIGGKNAVNVYDGNVTLGSMSINSSVDTSIQTLPDTSSLPSGCNIQIGGQDSFNVHGGTVTAEHIEIGQLTTPYNINQCRGEGVDMPDASAKSSDSNLKKLTDNTLSEIAVSQYKKTMKSVGVLLKFDQPIGTVFRVGTKYVMTAYHCVQLIIDPLGNGVTDWDNLKHHQVLVSFNYPSVNPGQTNFNIQDVTYINNEFDIVILELTDTSQLPPALKLYQYEIPYMQVSYVDIIGFGHPRSVLKTLDHTCQIMLPGDEVLQSAQAWLHQERARLEKGLKAKTKPSDVHWGYGGYDKKEKMVFNCYLEHGSSGAPILTTKCFAGPVVVGVVTNGLPYCFWDLTSTAQLMFPERYRFEMGTRMMHIYQHVVSKDSALARDLFG